LPRDRRTRKPTQARSRATVEAIVEASARIVVQDGYAALSTNRIAEVAGVSVGTLYQYFRNKEEVVQALVERQSHAMIDAFSRALADLITLAPEELDDGVAALLDATLAALRVNPALTRRLILEAPRGGDADLERLWRQRYTELVRSALYQRRDQVRSADVELMAYVVVTAGYAVFVDAAAYRPELLATEALRDELHHLVVRYLGQG